MTLTLQLNADTEDRLRRQAEVAGLEVAAYATRLLAQTVARPSIDELLAPLRKEFEGSGTTDEQLVDQVTEARDSYRADRSRKPA